MEHKLTTVRVKAGEGDLTEGRFQAHAATFVRTPDAYGDVIAPGAFDATLKEWADSGDTIPILWGHDMQDPFANIGGVLTAEDDGTGLLIDGQLDMDNPTAVQVYRLIKGRRVTKMSFAFDVLDAGDVVLDDDTTAHELRSLRLYEVSIVPIPANPTAEIFTVKDAADRVAAGVKAGRVLAQKHIDSLRSAQEAIGAVIEAAEATTTDDSQEKASAKPAVKPEEPHGAKGEERPAEASARTLAARAALAAAQSI